MNKNKLKTVSLAAAVSSALFSLLCFSWYFDVSLTAFPLSAAVTVCLYYFGFNRLFSKNEVKSLKVFRLLLQYHPYILLIAFVFRRAGQYGMPFAADFAAVILWCVSSVLDLVILYHLNQKRVGKIDAEWKSFRGKTQSSKGIRRFLLEVLSWVDALVQAVFMVLLLNIFIVQLYQIPSESMVPEFLIGDRLVVFKSASGPKFPLSKVGLPYFKDYKKGDIVVFRNPHYASDRKSEVKSFLSQLIYMCSLTTVNLNVDSDGNPKADPLVKRVVAAEGEQIMMQDGVLYFRTKDNLEWRVSETDAEYAGWDLNSLPPSVKRNVQTFPLEEDEVQKMLECEKMRREFDVMSFAGEAEKTAERFASLYRSSKTEKSDSNLEEYFNQKNMFEYALFARHHFVAEKLLSSKGADAWFSAFMTDWIQNYSGDFDGNLYEEANFKLNLMIKKVVGSLIVRDAELLNAGTEVEALPSDMRIRGLLQEATLLNSYLFLQDRRNMPVFPENGKDGGARFIPKDCFFMMGDNRFNSLDLRHSYNEWLAPLTKYDRYSVTYVTNMKPQYVHKSSILGTTCFRFFPPSRIGIPGRTGRK